MRVFDVVMHIERGAATSARPGRWLVDHFDREDFAVEYTGKCNDRHAVNGIRFEVESHDECSPARAISQGDFARQCCKEKIDADKAAGTTEADAIIARFIAQNS